MKSSFESIFVRLRAVLQRHAGTLSMKDDSSTCYCLEGRTGPAALRAWGGKMRKTSIPVAWVQIGKKYVSYHLMGIYGNAKLCDGMSKELKARRQGKTCFNFKSDDDALFQELEQLTVQALADFRKAGYVAEQKSG